MSKYEQTKYYFVFMDKKSDINIIRVYKDTKQYFVDCLDLDNGDDNIRGSYYVYLTHVENNVFQFQWHVQLDLPSTKYSYSTKGYVIHENDIETYTKNKESIVPTLINLRIPIEKSDIINTTLTFPIPDDFQGEGGSSKTSSTVNIAGKRFKVYVKLVIDGKTEFFTVKQAERVLLKAARNKSRR